MRLMIFCMEKGKLCKDKYDKLTAQPIEDLCGIIVIQESGH